MFKHLSGYITVVTPGMTIDHEWISGCVAVDADNVTIKDSLIASQDRCHGGGSGETTGGQINTGQGPGAPTNLLVEDTTVDGVNSGGGDRAVGSQNITCLRCDITGATDDFTAGDNAKLQDSYVHGLSSAPGPHEQGVNADTATNTDIEHSYITADCLGSSCPTTGALFMGESYGNSSGLTINDSYLEGDAGADVAIGCGNTDITVRNDALSSNSSTYGDESGHGRFSWGANGTWSGNYDPQTKSTIPPPGAACS